MLTFGTLSEWIFHLANLSVETVSINITVVLEFEGYSVIY